jgi:hypothetical protein
MEVNEFIDQIQAILAIHVVERHVESKNKAVSSAVLEP